MVIVVSRVIPLVARAMNELTFHTAKRRTPLIACCFLEHLDTENCPDPIDRARSRSIGIGRDPRGEY